MSDLRVVLDEQDFKKLVRGETVEKEVDQVKIKIILADMGYQAMLSHIKQALDDNYGF